MNKFNFINTGELKKSCKKIKVKDTTFRPYYDPHESYYINDLFINSSACETIALWTEKNVIFLTVNDTVVLRYSGRDIEYIVCKTSYDGNNEWQNVYLKPVNRSQTEPRINDIL